MAFNLLAGSGAEAWADTLAQRLGSFRIPADCSEYLSGERRVVLEDDFGSRPVALIGRLGQDPDSGLLELCLLADAAKHAGAPFVYLFLPYLPYSRQTQRGGSELIPKLLASSGIDKLITLDAHSHPKSIPFQNIPVHQFWPTCEWPDYDLIAVPDAGALPRVQALADSLDIPLVNFVKERDNEDGFELIGEFDTSLKGRRVLLVDDICDSGMTLGAALQGIRALGAAYVDIAVTHWLASENTFEALKQFGANHIYTSDSCPSEIAGLKIISCLTLLEGVLNEASS